MPRIPINVSVPANSSVNAVRDSAYERMPFHAHIEIALNQQSGTIGQVLATVSSGTDILSQEGPISFNARYPVYPDDYNLEDDAAQGDPLVITLRNTTGGAIVVVGDVRLTPL